VSSFNWVDRAVSFFSPSRGLQRAQARVAMSVLLDYDGAKQDRRTEGWYRPSTSGDAEAGVYHRDLRDSARDLVRNNPHAAKGLSVLVANRVGTGIMCQPNGVNKKRNARLADVLNRWIDNCDLAGRLDWYGIQALVERTRSEAGECLVRMVPVEVGENDVPLRLQVLEPDYLDSDKHERLGPRHVIRYGVEYLNGAPVGYWIFDEHPGDASAFPMRLGYQSRRIDASEMLHVFKPLRAEQGRGVTEFAQVIKRLRALDDYDVAEVMRKKIAACAVAAVTSSAGLPGASIAPTTTDSSGNRIEKFQPGMIPYLKPGEGIEFFDPKPSGDYSDFNSVQLHAIASGLNLPYELLTGDLSEVTYTSHRGGLVQFRGMVEADQWQVIIPQLCAPVMAHFTRHAARVNGGIDPRTTWTYTPPRFGLLDPAKEIPAMVAAIESGIDSYPNVIRREGYDWREKLDEIEEFQTEVASRGLKLTSIPEPKQPAASQPPASDEDAAQAA
jgi:lambda family phage portal protein